MNDPAQALRNFVPQHEHFVGVDSDGCAFDTMDLKHRECFVPVFIQHFALQPVARAARQVWEFVNLHSRTRGINRYPALSNALNLLAEHPDVVARGCAIPSSDDLDAWMASEPFHSIASLAQEVEGRGNEALRPVLEWSRAVDARIEDLVRGVPPFPGVREALDQMRQRADVVVVSQTPVEALAREWREHGLADRVALLAGQEMGSKKDHLKLATSGRYASSRILMIGDAPNDFTAAKSNHALFYPIVPGREEASWARLLDEGLDAFLSGSYAGDYEAGLVREFNAGLPEGPPW